MTHIRVFLDRSRDMHGDPRYIATRLSHEHNPLTSVAIAYGLKQREIPYDRRYLTDEAALYCSELVVELFKAANGGVEFFEESPMSFRDTETVELHKYWVNYYGYFGMEVPKGEPGSNPGDISRDKRLHVYNVVGDISGYQP